MTLRLLACCTVLCASMLPAQRGGGVPGAYITPSTGLIGGTLTVDFGYPGLSGAPLLLSISDGFGPTTGALVGQVWLDTNSPAYAVLPYTADSFGNARVQVPLPPDPALFDAAPLFANALALGPGFPAPGWALSKSVRVHFDTLDGFRPAGNLLEPRSNHTATLMSRDRNDNVSEVLIAGGSTGSIIIPVPTATTEIWSPLTRTFRPGPAMALARTAHTATLLDNGLILLCGGITTGGPATDHAELFDPISETFLPAPPMSTPRSGHASTLLPDGRVLVTGGVSDWTDAATNFVARLNTAQDSGELYDPATNTWTPLSQPMAVARLGHTQTLLSDGRVLIVGGISGGAFTGTFPGSQGQVPVHTASCEFFDFANDSLAPAPSLAQSRGYHAASATLSGGVVVTGGSVTSAGFPTSGGAAIATSSCEFFDGNGWNAAPPLAQDVAFHSQIASGWNGDAIIMGGFIGDFTLLFGSSVAMRHNGTLAIQTVPVGVHPRIPGSLPAGRGTFSLTQLQDGSYLIVGGASWPATFTDAYTLVEFQ